MSSLYLDIETAPIDNAAAFVEEPTAPGNYKDAAKIEAYIAEAKAKAVDRCALDFGLLRIGALGLGEWTEDGTIDTAAVFCPTETAERDMLLMLWGRVELTFRKGGMLVGYNLAEFDMPALITRSWFLGVTPGFQSVRRYDDPHIVDLMQITSFGRIDRTKKLSWWADRLGWPYEKDLAGREMPALIQAGDWEAVGRHVRSDVALTMHLHRLLTNGRVGTPEPF